MSHTPSAAGQSQTLSPRLILQTQSGRTQRSDAGLYSDLDRKVVNVRSTCFRLMPDICISLPIADQGDSRTRSQGSLMYAEGSDTGRTSKERILNAILSVTGNLSCSVSSIFLYICEYVCISLLGTTLVAQLRTVWNRRKGTCQACKDEFATIKTHL